MSHRQSSGYEVVGNTLQEVRESMNARGPVGEDGVGYHGDLKWQLEWAYQFAPKGRLCGLDAVKVKLKATMKLPAWKQPDDGVSEDLVREWDRYITALRHHEDGHYETAVAAADEIKQRLSKLRGRTDCAAVGKDADAQAQEILEEFRAKDRDYDATTHHGITQGAQF